jgi:hypothetical protein
MISDAEHRALGVSTFNHCWDLLEQPSTSERNEELLTNAFTSLYHWRFVATPKELAIGEWMVARAAAEGGWSDLALTYMNRSSERLSTFDAPDWLVASTSEGFARVYLLGGQLDEARIWFERARQQVASIASEGERAVIASQVEELSALIAPA